MATQTDHVVVSQPGDPLLSRLIESQPEISQKKPIAVAQLLTELTNKQHEFDVAKETLQQARERDKLLKDQHQKDQELLMERIDKMAKRIDAKEEELTEIR